MKRILSLFLGVFAALTTFCQTEYTYEFTGKVYFDKDKRIFDDTVYSIHGGYQHSIDYAIFFNKENDGKIKGVAVTFNPVSMEHDSSLIEGVIKDRKISFEEVKPIYSNYEQTKGMVLSLFYATEIPVVEYSKDYSIKQIEGEFFTKSYDYKGNPIHKLDNMWEGSILLTGKMDFEESDFASSKKLNKSKINQLRGKDEVFLTCEYDTLRIEIFDAEVSDKDSLAIYIDGKFQANVGLQKEKFSMNVPCKKGVLKLIEFVAINEGSNPPNTSTIFVYDNDKKYHIYFIASKSQRLKLYVLKPKF